MLSINTKHRKIALPRQNERYVLYLNKNSMPFIISTRVGQYIIRATTHKPKINFEPIILVSQRNKIDGEKDRTLSRALLKFLTTKLRLSVNEFVLRAGSDLNV